MSSKKIRRGQPDWEKHKSAIMALRMKLNRKTYTMKHLQAELAREPYNFNVTKMQLENRVRAWRITKTKIPAIVMKKIDQTVKERTLQGKETVVEWRGEIVRQGDLNVRIKRIEREVTSLVSEIFLECELFSKTSAADMKSLASLRFHTPFGLDEPASSLPQRHSTTSSPSEDIPMMSCQSASVRDNPSSSQTSSESVSNEHSLPVTSITAPEDDEYIIRETDEDGEKKVQVNGELNGGRIYRCKTFTLPERGEKLFMLATECARVLSYRDSCLFFKRNPAQIKIITEAEKDFLIQKERMPYRYRSRSIAIVTARSVFRWFGSRVIENGRCVRDDYWESEARKQGLTEEDPAGKKRPSIRLSIFNDSGSIVPHATNERQERQSSIYDTHSRKELDELQRQYQPIPRSFSRVPSTTVPGTDQMYQSRERPVQNELLGMPTLFSSLAEVARSPDTAEYTTAMLATITRIDQIMKSHSYNFSDFASVDLL